MAHKPTINNTLLRRAYAGSCNYPDNDHCIPPSAGACYPNYPARCGNLGCCATGCSATGSTGPTGPTGPAAPGTGCAMPSYTFVANGHSIVQIDPITHQTHAMLELPCTVHFLAADPQQRRLYFLCNNGCAGVYDLNTNTVSQLPQISGYYAAVNPNNQKLYVSTDEQVLVLNGFTNEIIANVPMQHPRDIVVNPNTNLVYVAADGGLNIINSNTDTVVGNIESDAALSAMKIDPCTNNLLVNVDNNGLGFIDANCNTLCEVIPVQGGVRAVAIDSRLGLAYAINAAGDQVFVFDLCTREIVGTLELPQGSFVNGISVDPTNHLLYLSTNYGILIVDGGMNKIIGLLPGVLNTGGLITMACVPTPPCRPCRCARSSAGPANTGIF
ncbi:MAG: YncE family protein [Oscillospiraceae bacterium]|nr:YncE family protein [Oscillospiraceae bacterium]